MSFGVIRLVVATQVGKSNRAGVELDGQGRLEDRAIHQRLVHNRVPHAKPDPDVEEDRRKGFEKPWDFLHHFGAHLCINAQARTYDTMGSFACELKTTRNERGFLSDEASQSRPTAHITIIISHKQTKTKIHQPARSTVPASIAFSLRPANIAA